MFLEGVLGLGQSGYQRGIGACAPYCIGFPACLQTLANLCAPTMSVTAGASALFHKILADGLGDRDIGELVD
jgi:hypothetical protein